MFKCFSFGIVTYLFFIYKNAYYVHVYLWFEREFLVCSMYYCIGDVDMFSLTII